MKCLNKTETPIFLPVVCSLFPKVIFLMFIVIVVLPGLFSYPFLMCSGQAEEPVNRDNSEQCHYTFYRTGLMYVFFSLHVYLVFPIRSYHIVFAQRLI